MLSCMQKKVKLESNSPQKSMWIIYMQKKVDLESNSPRTACGSPACRRGSISSS